jgi:hypothetical protein
MILRGLARNTWGTVKTSQICGLYTPPHISNFPWTPFGVHGESTRTAFPLLPLFQESMWTLCGVHMDFVKFMDSMKTCDQVSCGLLWTPSEVHGLSVDCCELLQKSMDSLWTAMDSLRNPPPLPIAYLIVLRSTTPAVGAYPPLFILF